MLGTRADGATEISRTRIGVLRHGLEACMRVTGVTVRSAITGDGEDCHWSERDEAEKRKKQCECHAYVRAARPPPLIRPSGRVHGVDNVISREVYCYGLEVWKGIDRTERDSTQDRRDDTILGSVQHSTVRQHNDIATQPHLTPAVYLKTCGISYLMRDEKP